MTFWNVRTKLTAPLALALAALFWVGACSESTTDPNGNGEEPAAEVDMTENFTFDGRTVTIQVGETVRWTNASSTDHTVTADPDAAQDPANVSLPEGADPFDSGFIGAGEEYSRTFDVPGRYDYICIPHEGLGMVGTVIVEE